MTRYLTLSLLTLAVIGCDAMTSHTDTVARVGLYELTVDDAVDLLAGNPQIPARLEVVESVADLWVDYTILTDLAAQDSTFANLDLTPLIEPYVEQQMYMQLRDQVMTGDTVISDEELQELYAARAPGLRVRARHILLSFPDAATGTQRDSVESLAETIRGRAAAGEDFSELARQYSADPGTARQGGDLGWFERGNMVEPFEEAAFALEVGEVSDVVETPFGLHIIKLDEREAPSLGDVQDNFRRRVISERQQASLESYVDALRAPREPRVRNGAEEVARELAEDPAAVLRGRAASRELVTWADGNLTARELRGVFRRMPQQQRAQYASATDEQMAALLLEISTNQMVLGDARERGVSVPEAEQDSIRDLIREEIGVMARTAELMGPAQEGETQAEAVERRVRAYLNGVLTGGQPLLPMGALPYTLRSQQEWRIHEQTFARVIERLEQRREDTGSATRGAPPATPAVPPGGPDTTG